MNDPIFLESPKPVRFEPYCIRCGRKTRGRYYLDNQDMAVAVASTFIPFFELVKIFSPSKISVPFCYRCKFNLFFPNKKAWLSLVLFFVCLSLGFYLFIHNFWYLGLPSFITAMYSLYLASKQNREFSEQNLPVSMKQENDKIIYVFTSGHYYDILCQQMENENRGSWKSGFELE
jgi:hypothetical protein